MGGVGKFIGAAVGGVGGFFATGGNPVGAIGGASLGASLGGSLDREKRRSKPPPVVNNVPAQNAIAPSLPPVDLVQVMDTITNNKLQVVRGTDNKASLMFQGRKLDLDKPINTGTFNPQLPQVRAIKGRDIDLKAAAVVALISEMQKFSQQLEQVESTMPQLIPQLQPLLSSYKEAQALARDRGFDLKQSGVEQKLAKLGISNSSTAFGLQVALARQKADAIVRDNLEYNVFAQDAKQRLQDSMYKRGENIANTAGTELNRYIATTGNEIAVRGQDMQTELGLQQLEQQRALNLENLNLERNQQLINADLGNRNLQLNQYNIDNNRLLESGLNLFNSGNNQALGARSIDNQNLAYLNQANQNQYKLRATPYTEAFNTGFGNFIGTLGTNAANKYLPPPKRQNN